MSYGLKYLLTWESARGNDYKIEVFKKNYSGNSIVKKLGGAPSLVIDNSGNGLCGTSLQFSIQADTDGELNELYTTDGKLFKVLLFRNSGVVWSGYLLQELYSEDYIAPPYDVAVTATDQLALLKDIPYTTSGRVSIFKVISNALAPTLLDIGYTVQCSLRPSVVASSYPFLDSVTVDDRGFAEMSCYEVLEGVLTTLHMRLQQINNTWGLIRENDISAMLHRYSSSLGHISSSSAVATMIGQMYENDVWPVGNLVLTKQAAKRGAKFLFTPLLPLSILDNPSMLSDVAWEYNESFIEGKPGLQKPYGDETIQSLVAAYVLNSTLGKEKSFALWQEKSVEASTDRLKMELSYLPIAYWNRGDVHAANLARAQSKLVVQISLTATDGTVYYLTQEGWLDEDEEDLIFTGRAVQDTISARANKEGYETVTVEFPGFPAAGDLRIAFRNDSRITADEFEGEFQAFLRMAVTNVFITLPSIEGYSSDVIVNDSAAQDAQQVDLLFADPFVVPNEQLLVYNTFEFSNSQTSTWELGGYNFDSFYKAIIQDYANSFGFVKNRFSGNISGANLINSIFLEKFSGSILRLESGVIDLKEDELNGEWLEVSSRSASVNAFEILTNEGQKVAVGSTGTSKAPLGNISTSLDVLINVVNTLNSIIGLDENDDAYIKLKKIKEEVEDENGELVEVEKEVPRNFYSFGEVSSGGVGSGNSGGEGSEGGSGSGGSGIDVLPLSQLGTDIGSEDLSKTFSAYAINSIYNDVKTLISGGGNYLTKELADTYYAPLSAFSTLSTNFNVLNTKITNFFSNEEDVDTTINRWKELEKFLQDYTETSTLADLLAGKADKSGVDNLANQVALNMANIETLTNTINSIEPTVVSNVARIGILETKVGENELNIQSNHEQILVLIDNYHIVDSKFENLKERIEVIESWFTLVDSDEDGVDDTLLCTQYNIASYGEVSSGGIGSGSSGGGGGSGVGNILPSTSLAAYGSTEKLTEVFSAYTTKLISDRVGVLEERNPINLSSMWGALASSGSEKIDVSHIPDLSGQYLPKSGGTINSKSYLGLVLNSPDTTLNQLQLRVNDEIKGIYQYNANFGVGFHHEGKGGIYVSQGGLPIFVSSSLDKYTLYHSGNFNPANYLLLTGGTISNSVYGKALTIHRSDSNYDSVIKFSNVSDGLLGYIGISGSATTQAPKTPYYSPDGDVLYPLIHSGNIGSQSVSYATNAGNADTLNGFHSDSFVKTYLSVTDNFTSFTNRVFFQTAYISGQGDFCSLVIPTYIGNKTDYYFTTELRFNNTSTNPEIRVTGPNGISDWYTLARTIDNVASATKLQDNTAYTAWGQTFFKNGKPQSVSGSLIGVDFIKFDSTNTYGFHKGSTFSSGFTESDLVYSAQNHRFYNGNSYAFTIKNSGNVGIGTISPAYKLDVAGTGRFTGALSVDNAISTQSITIGGATLTWDAESECLIIDKNLAAYGEVSSGDIGDGSASGGNVNLLQSWSGEWDSSYALSAGLGVDLNNRLVALEANGGINLTSMWSALATDDSSKVIHSSHIPDLSDTYLYMPLHKPSSSGIDLNTLLTGGGKVFNYGSAALWQNAPAMNYGSVFQFNSYENNSDYLAVQLAFDINHRSTTTTRGFWYRTRDDVSWANANWKRVLDDSNYGDYALPLSGGTLSGKLTIKASGYPYIEFKAGDITRGYYGFSGTGIAAIWDTEIWQTLIHSGNIAAYNAGSATKLQDNTAYTAWGQTFFENGKPKNVGGGLSATTGSFSSTLSVLGNTTLNNVDINANYEFVCNGAASFTTIKPISANTYDLGTDFFRWNNAYINTLDLSGNISVGGTLSVAKATTLSDTLSVAKATTLSGTLSVSQLASFRNVEVGSGYSLTCYGNGYFTYIYPKTNNTYNLGSSSAQWNNLFAQNINCATGELNISAKGVINFTNTAAASSSTPTIYAPVITSFYLLAPNGGQIGMSNVRWENVYSKYGDFENSIYIGSARVWWDSENDCLRVSKNFASDGEVSSGGVKSDSSDSESSNAPILGGTISGDLDVTGKVTIGGLTTMNSGFLSKSIQVGSMNNDSIGFGNCSIDLFGSLYLNNPTTGKWASFTISDTSEMVVINRALSVVSLTQTSDIRFKQVAEDVCLSSEVIANAPMFRFTWADSEDGKVHIGTSAQYWMSYAPELTAFVDNKHTLDYATLGVLIGKSNATEIEQLKERVRVLEQEVECYRRMLNAN